MLTARRAHSAVVTLVAAACLLACVAASATAATAPTTRLIVGFRASASATTQTSVLRSARAGTATKRTTGLRKLRAAVLVVRRDRVAATKAQLLRRADVAYVEVDGTAHAADLGAQATSGVAAQWRPSDTFLDQQWGLTTMGVQQAWELTRGTGITVAVVDTGVDYSHPDLAGKVVLGRDFVDKDDDPMDVEGHGTHVSGIVAAKADDANGVAGVAPEAKILAVRVLDTKGEGDYANVADGIVYAVDHGAKVVNLSLGGPEQSTLLQAAVGYASARGVVVTCASGNEGSTSVGYPASYDGCTSIGAVDSGDAHPDFSNRGSRLDLVAPGVQILSTTMGGSWESWDGTSMATPFASGEAALLAAQGLGRRDILAAMASTAKDLGAPGKDALFGNGRLDAAAATAAAARVPRRAADTVKPVVSGLHLLEPRRATTSTRTTTWKVRSRTGWKRVGTTDFAGPYAWNRTTTRGAVRTVTSYRMRGGVVYRNVVKSARTRSVTKKTAVFLRVEVLATDDLGVDRTSLELDGKTVAVDWSSADGWILEAPCTAGDHTLAGLAFDAADNGAGISQRTTLHC